MVWSWWPLGGYGMDLACLQGQEKGTDGEELEETGKAGENSKSLAIYLSDVVIDLSSNFIPHLSMPKCQAQGGLHQNPNNKKTIKPHKYQNP